MEFSGACEGCGETPYVKREFGVTVYKKRGALIIDSYIHQVPNRGFLLQPRVV
jgi:hypothetical protein